MAGNAPPPGAPQGAPPPAPNVTLALAREDFGDFLSAAFAALRPAQASGDGGQKPPERGLPVSLEPLRNLDSLVLSGYANSHAQMGLNTFGLLPESEADARAMAERGTTAAQLVQHEDTRYSRANVAHLGTITAAARRIRDAVAVVVPAAPAGQRGADGELLENLKQLAVSLEALEKGNRDRLGILIQRELASPTDTIQSVSRATAELAMLRQHGAFKTYTSETLDMIKEKHMDAVLQEVAKQAGKDGAALVAKAKPAGNNGNNNGNRHKGSKNNKSGNGGNGGNGGGGGGGGAGSKPAPTPRS